MRLTLRTLLAYLDDTLEPAQAKLIGQKVAESDTARELIERIKQVTRRRRLAAPPTAGPGGNIDANTIAEYLDNEVSAEQSGEVEQICLASDVHLAEVAACHQILTLVLGEPALVPATTKQRMYGLVKGKEAIHQRKPPKTQLHREPEVAESKETDETLRLGLPPFRLGADMKQRLLLWGGGILAGLLLVIAMWQILSMRGEEEPLPDQFVKATTAPTGKPTVAPSPTPDDKALKEKLEKERLAKLQAEKDALAKDQKAKELAAQKQKEFDDLMGKGTQALADKKADEAIAYFEAALKIFPDNATASQKMRELLEQKTFQPIFLDVAPAISTKDAVVGHFVTKEEFPSVLLQDRGKAGWQRLQGKDADARSMQPLVSLPGFRSVVESPTGVRMTLWGVAPEVWPATADPFLRLGESMVVLHAADQLDLDLTLRRGRIILTSMRADRAARVRVRFHDPIKGKLAHLDISLLTKDAEVLVERRPFPYFLTGFDPHWQDAKRSDRKAYPAVSLGVAALSGHVQIRANDNLPIYALEAPPGDALLVWDSRQGNYIKLPMKEVLPGFVTDPAPPKEKKQVVDWDGMRRACKELTTKLNEAGRTPVAHLNQIMSSKEAAKALRILALRSMAGLDQTEALFELCVDEDQEIRQAAMRTLESWVVQDPENDLKLAPGLKERFGGAGVKFMEMLHGFGFDEKSGPSHHEVLADYAQTNPSPLVRSMAMLRLQDQAIFRAMMAPPDKKKTK